MAKAGRWSASTKRLNRMGAENWDGEMMLRREETTLYGIDSPVLCLELDDSIQLSPHGLRKQKASSEPMVVDANSTGDLRIESLEGQYKRPQYIPGGVGRKPPPPSITITPADANTGKLSVLHTVCENVPVEYGPPAAPPACHERPGCRNSPPPCLSNASSPADTASSDEHNRSVISEADRPSSGRGMTRGSPHDHQDFHSHRPRCVEEVDNAAVISVDVNRNVPPGLNVNSGGGGRSIVETSFGDQRAIAVRNQNAVKNQESSAFANNFFNSYDNNISDNNNNSNNNKENFKMPKTSRPRIQINLTRAKSSFTIVEEEDVEKENGGCFQSQENVPRVRFSTDSSENLVEDSKTTSFANGATRKGSRYIGKLRSMFSMKSASTSLPNLSAGPSDALGRSMRDLTSSLSQKTPLQDSKASICEGDSSNESLDDNLDRAAVKEKLVAMNTILSEKLEKTRKSKKRPKRDDGRVKPGNASADEDKTTDEEEKGEEEDEDNFGEDAVYLDRRAVSKPLPIKARDPSYSLVRSPSELDEGTTISFTRIPSFRGRQMNAKLERHFLTSSLATHEDGEESQNIKDATDIQPFESGEAIVTDTLSNKMVHFDADGYSKITFAVESGSEPWATCLTQDGAMAVTLKRQGCVALWSTSGEPMIEFGQRTLSAPTGIRCDSRGRFIVTDEQSNSVFIFNKHGKYLTELSSGETPSPTSSSSLSSSFPQTFSPTKSSSLFNQPRYVCVSHNGKYVISDSANHCVRIFDAAGNYVTQFGGYGRKDGQMKFPYGVACDRAGNIYVADHYNSRVSLFTEEGEFIEHLLTSENADITKPKGLAVMNSLLFVTYGDLRANKISVYRLTKTHERRVVHNRV